MGYIDKGKMLRDIVTRQSEHLMKDDDLEFAFWEKAQKYVRQFPEEDSGRTDADTVDIMWIEIGERCLVRINGVFYDAKRAVVKDCDRAKIFKIALNLVNPAESPTEAEHKDWGIYG